MPFKLRKSNIIVLLILSANNIIKNNNKIIFSSHIKGQIPGTPSYHYIVSNNTLLISPTLDDVIKPHKSIGVSLVVAG